MKQNHGSMDSRPLLLAGIRTDDIEAKSERSTALLLVDLVQMGFPTVCSLRLKKSQTV